MKMWKEKEAFGGGIRIGNVGGEVQRKCNKKRSRVEEVGNEGKVGESQSMCTYM